MTASWMANQAQVNAAALASNEEGAIKLIPGAVVDWRQMRERASWVRHVADLPNAKPWRVLMQALEADVGEERYYVVAEEPKP